MREGPNTPSAEPRHLRRYVLSGCSGGGKSSLLAELARHGYQTVEEPGRVIVREEQAMGGDALPWINPQGFADRAIKMSLDAFDAASQHDGPVFFDRSFIDAISYMTHINGALSPEHEELAREKRYEGTVFLVPPWPEIFVNDEERKLGFDVAVEEYERLTRSYEAFGYRLNVVPKVSVPERAELVLKLIQM